MLTLATARQIVAESTSAAQALARLVELGAQPVHARQHDLAGIEGAYRGRVTITDTRQGVTLRCTIIEDIAAPAPVPAPAPQGSYARGVEAHYGRTPGAEPLAQRVFATMAAAEQHAEQVLADRPDLHAVDLRVGGRRVRRIPQVR